MPAHHFLQPLLSRTAPAGSALTVEGAQVPFATTLEVALDSEARRRGLLGRDGLDVGAAFVIAPCSAVHTVGMRFPIDVVFTTRDGRIAKIARGLAPRRVAFSLGAFAAIEMAAGAADRHQLKVGDSVRVI